MKLPYSQVLNTLEGGTIPDGKGGAMTLGSMIVTACSSALDTDRDLQPLDKYKLGEIGVCAHRGLDLTAEQVAVVKDRIARVFVNPVVVYLAHELIEGGAKKK